MFSFRAVRQRQLSVLGSALLSRTQQSPGLLLPASTSRRAVRSRSSFRASPDSIPQKTRPPLGGLVFCGAGDEARTRYLDLGKVALYQMSYARKRKVDYSA